MMTLTILPTLQNTAAEKDYDLAGGGWVPDYQDPSTYLESLSPVNGSVFYYLGVDAGSNSPSITAVDFGKYAELLKRCQCRSE